MKAQAEVSVYPLRTATLTERIDQFLGHVHQTKLRVQLGPMSTRIKGDSTDIFRALHEGFDAVAAHGDVVLSITISNACPDED